MAEQQKSDTYSVVFNASSGKFIPVKNAERLKRAGKTGSDATMEKVYLANGLEAKVLERALSTAQNNILYTSLVGKITSLDEVVSGSV
ncbi:hypothetical protein FCL47_02760 [Desulfopila sp. IMCC35006]|uniref:hypothetical protein n=1 Tax=Desulfopila sp. IMCC35006 TaxID=2569542 RepID=UPI0010AB7759|nr:hypothetical protein [Desulfopila sp. IMCC35006]TKB28424.1 hypothetical protein FCL47_02760 [Desulfopila sp. IMCC35006]